ncbi:MAG: DUF2635 domain-containing protein [Planctomycetes bacterium]|nr:DUF2635 domain-containing protein [Planctomycetota bacterium]
MKLKAATGLQCPMEGKPREYINDDPKGVVVPDTSYYQRLVDDGSLVLVQAKTKGGDQ